MPAKEYDVLIIGSGASGGMAAYNLTKKGIKCLLLDARQICSQWAGDRVIEF